MNNAEQQDGYGAGGYLPLAYYCDFLKLLAENRSHIEIITYRDLIWGHDYDHAHQYPHERAAWKECMRRGTLDSSKIYVLLQHDVDSSPERTSDVLREEEQLGLRSNVMIFNRRICRQRLKATGDLVYTDYPLDYEYLRYLQDYHGFVVGYHCNALEQAIFHLGKARQIFEADVRALRQHFNIDFYSPHGGVPGPDGQNNHSVTVPDTLRASLRWVHNHYSPWFTRSYSDGGINSPKRDPAKRDLRDFVRSWQPGGRYRVLTHPQYYSSNCGRSPRLSGTPWYEEVLSLYGRGTSTRAWQGIATALSTGEKSTWRGFVDRIRRFFVARLVPN